MATNNKDLAQAAENLLNAGIAAEREPAQPQAAPWQPVSGIRDDGARAARATIGGAKD